MTRPGGTSIGHFASAPLLSYVIQKFDLKTGFILEGALTSCCLLVALLLKAPNRSSEDSKVDNNDKDADGSQSKRSSLWKNQEFLHFSIGYALNCFSFLVPDLFIVSMLVESEEPVTLINASFAITILGICNLFGHLLCGIVDHIPQHIMKVNAISSILSGLVVAAMVHSNVLYLSYGLCGLYGFVSSPVIALGPPTIKELVGTDSYNSALSINLFTYGVMNLSGWSNNHISNLSTLEIGL